ncbi:hypothetical protein G7Y89_g13418 [Cudoniella acicularis]|uniref:Carrier domain-containing protein n=1 Tax=Cudoniella acicularis TaxID=354080 RepID=A0A8H4R8K6_9HELO|nr:hypothetical protein G7Y89_g13418 [Cudoniella acicularis]
MASVGKEYEILLGQAFGELIQLEELHGSTRYPPTRWVSSVTPQKTMDYTSPQPAYWRQNLESPVQFTQAIEAVVGTENSSVDILIEIGPHSALQTPLKQILAKCEANHGVKPPVYLPSLKRKEDGMLNILTLCGSLFTLNYPIDLGLVNSVDRLEKNSLRYVHGSVCTDLPTYQFNHASVMYHENRVSRDVRKRRYLRHDLLGVLQAGCAKDRPVWRNILRIKDIPWLNDHLLLPDPVLPASGYVCLAIEAAFQFLTTSNKYQKGFTFKLRNVSIKSAMLLPDDDIGIEIMLNLQASSTAANWLEFKISSVTPGDDIWTEHASGLVTQQKPPLRNIGPLNTDLDPRVIEVNQWYEKFIEIGLGYGKSFRGLSELLSDPIKNISTAKVSLNTTEGMFSGPESSYEIHPASLDLCHQLALIACHGGQTERVRHAFIPVFIDDITVWPRNFEKWGQGVAVGHLKGLRGAHANVQLFTQSGEPRLQITNLRCVSHDSGKFHPVKDGYQPSPYTRLVWKPDFSSLSLDQARVLFPSTVVDKSIQTNFDILDKISAYMIAEIEQRYPTSTCNNPNLKKFLLWIHQSASKELAYVNEARQMSAEQRLLAIENTCLTFNNLIDVKHTKFIYDNLPAILAGTITGEEIAHQAGTLSELQAASIEVAAAYPQLERLLDLAGHRDPSMKILEIGAGTGAATQVAMKTLGGETRSKRYGSYTLTDNSTSSLQILQLNFSECRSVSYKELDITQCPTRQDLERDFDLIIATKSLRTTNDIFGVLGNIRKLLKTGGRMIFLAPRRQLLIHGLALGTFTDYWGDSADREPNFPNLEEWGDMLKSAGFSGIDLELTDYSSSLGVVSTFVTTAVGNAPGARICKSDGAVYIIYYRHLQNLHTLLEIELQNNGIAPILKSLEDCDIPNDSRVIFAVDFDFSIMADGKEQDFNQVKRLVRRASTLLWLTNGGLLEGHNPKAAIATGLIRMLTTENPIANYGILHLNPEVTLSDRETAQLIIQREGFLHEGDPENELALHDNIVHISRLVLDEGLNDRYRSQNKSVSTTDAMPLYGQGPMVIDFKTPGLLTSLYFKRDESHWTALQDDWVEIRTYAIGLNWKDLAVSAGKVDMDTFSSECSGVVTKVGKLVQRFRPGDQVYSLAWAKFGTSARFPASFAQLMEKDDTFSAMASVPLVFCTAVYALNHLARLQKGEKVLIQSATGGVGLAAIQIAQNIGAEIFATVGTEEKAQYLFDEYHIPRDRILSSRDMTNLSSLVLATDSKGFDVILSSSNGEIMYESLRCIAPMGRFIDVGRVEVQNHGAMALEIFSKNAMFASFDLSLIAIQNPGFCSKLMEEVGNLLRKRSIQPIAPIKTFDISELDRALLHFSKGQHIGKIVVTYENPTSTVKMLPPPLHATFDPEAEYILAGGLGGLGRSILKWMVDRGAKNLTVLSRSSTASPEAEAMINELATQKVEVNITSCDVIVKEEVRNAMVAIRARSNQRRIRGVIHAAAIIHDRLFDTMPYAQWKRGLGAKVEGTINLHEVSLEYELPLDFFVMTSSFEAVVAMPTQAAYCAANSFQDAFARYRRARGLPACSIAFGLITEIGDFGQRAITRNMIQRHGLYPTGEIGFLRLFEAAFLEPPNNNSSWRRFDHLSESQITTCLEPSKLARMSQTENRNTAKAPRWYSDRKFCHLFQAMEDHLTVEKQPHDVKTVTPTITFAVDAAIKARNMDEGCRIVTNAIMEQTAGLLMIPFESIEPRKSVAEYGVDSLIAVELRNWFVLLFESAIPLLKLLDERVNISELGAWIVGERELKLKV